MEQTIDIEVRANAGEQYFMQGYNCAQSVVAAFGDLFPEVDTEQLLKVAASFGGGMGRLRMTCGAVTGMFMLAGLENGSSTPGNQELCPGARARRRVQGGERFAHLRPAAGPA